MHKARFPGFYKLSVADRLDAIRENGWITTDDQYSLTDGHHVLQTDRADKMIENVIGVMGLPLGVGLNFVINGKDYIVPLVVEEPSIVAALSASAKIFSASGGIEAHADDSLLIGQIQIVSPPDVHAGKAKILERKHALIARLNELHPNMVERGGGARDIEARILDKVDGIPQMLIVHLLVDTCDAMGANIVNAMCEEIAPEIESITGGRVFLRILSNLTDRSVVRASVTVGVEQLEGKGFSGAEVRDGIVLASQFASQDPYRAATHNKGIMNGIDPLAIATGNDWRALEASAHAYAARSGKYTALSQWRTLDDGSLRGEIEIPIKVGTQGGSLQANNTVMISYRMLGVNSAKELAELMAAVGLAQNFSAIKALSTEGIQKGHMSLHARSVALTAGAPKHLFESVVSRIIADGDIKVQRAVQIIQEMTRLEDDKEADSVKRTVATAYGKIILLGEHAVVYGRPAVAIPIPNAVSAEVVDADVTPEIRIPAWNIDGKVASSDSLGWSVLQDVFKQLGVEKEHFFVHVEPNIPPAVGLGSSAATAVAVIRAVAQHFDLGLADDEVNRLAFLCEKAAHGTPSGIDNSIATYGKPLIFQSGEQPRMEVIEVSHSFNFVVGVSDQASLTVGMVAGVRERWRKHHDLYEQLFDNFGGVAATGIDAIYNGDYETLGHMMNINHGLLSAIQVSSAELDRMTQTARANGALGAKLTGAGGGGSIVALCEGESDKVAQALSRAGAKTLQVTL